jgi:hypothetical protein
LIEAGAMNFCITHHPPFKPEWETRIKALAEKYPRYIQWQRIEENELGNRGGLVTPKYQEDLNKTGCYGPTSGQVIDIDGNYLFCCCDYFRKHPMGNVFEHSILEGWRNVKYSEARESARNKKPILDVCVGCFSVKSGPKPSASSRS